MHPKIYALGRMWREGEYRLRCETVTVMGAMAPLRLELAELAGPRGFVRPLAVVRNRIGRLDLPDYRPIRGVERRFFPEIVEKTRPYWVSAIDWAMIAALSVAAQPAVVMTMVCKARYEVFDHIEAFIPYLWEEVSEVDEGLRALHLDRPVP